jgi:hypothetical protein
VSAAEADAARIAAAARSLVAGAPPPPPGVGDLTRLGVLGDWRQYGSPPLPPAAPEPAPGAPAPPAAAVRAVPLNSFAFCAETRPGAAALARARARLALPGTDVPPAEEAEQRGALRRAAAAQRRAATRLPLFLLHGEGGRCGAALRAVAAGLDMPVFGLELAPALLAGGGAGGEGGEGAPALPATLQELAARCGPAGIAAAVCWPPLRHCGVDRARPTRPQPTPHLCTHRPTTQQRPPLPRAGTWRRC